MKRVFPFPAYPNGWFAVSYSDEVKSGEVKPLGYFGNPLVVYRTEAGEVHRADEFQRRRLLHAECAGLGPGPAVPASSVGGSHLRAALQAQRVGAAAVAPGRQPDDPVPASALKATRSLWLRGVVAADRVDHAARTLAALDLDGDTDRGLDATVLRLFDSEQLRAAADS